MPQLVRLSEAYPSAELCRLLDMLELQRAVLGHSSSSTPNSSDFSNTSTESWQEVTLAGPAGSLDMVNQADSPSWHSDYTHVTNDAGASPGDPWEWLNIDLVQT